MKKFYTDEKNVQMLIFLLKAHGIQKVVASPGNTNVTFVGSIQNDSFFEIYSAPDERSAAYMACGLSAESGEPVVLTCTGATASRNYVPGLTEAFYRKLPVLAVTSTQHEGRVGQLAPQVIDRSVIQNDIAVKSVSVRYIYGGDDEWEANIKLNDAILALRHRGGGPVHINLTTNYDKNFNVKELPEYRVIHRVTTVDTYPQITAKSVGIFVGAHLKWSRKLTEAVDSFCEAYNGVVFCDHTSNYHGKYGVQYNLVSAQREHTPETSQVELLIDLAEVTGAYMTLFPREVWRVNEDGLIRDRFRKLTHLFDMSEFAFFEHYVQEAVGRKSATDYCTKCRTAYRSLLQQIPELPFSNAWIAQKTSSKIPDGSVLHLGILNSLRSWNFFETGKDVDCYSNTGGFGIDGVVSTLIGASLVDHSKLYFVVVGDLAFFYDLNSIANRHVGNNIRILLINNGVGAEFKNYSHFAAQFGEDADHYMAAAGHYGRKSPELVKHYALDLGFTYVSATTKEEYLKNIEQFVSPEIGDKPILMEVFTSDKDESDALKLIDHIIVDPISVGKKAKSLLKGVIGEEKFEGIKKIIKR